MPEKEAKGALVAQTKLPVLTPEQVSDLTPAKQQEYLSARLFGNAASMDVVYTEYGKKCAANAIVQTMSYLKSNNKSFKDVDVDLYMLTLHSVALTELNCAANPSECYVELRGNILAIKPQGAGNERLTRRFGVAIKPKTGLHTCWKVREGDEFHMPQFNGLEVTPPVWKPATGNMANKVVVVVYPVEKTDGTIEYLIADRNSVKSNVVAQIRQTLLYAFYKTDEKGYRLKDKYGRFIVDAERRDKAYALINAKAEAAKTLDEFLDDPEVAKVLNPTYTSYGSREAMIVRKMQNNALKQYPKDYESSAVAEAMKLMDEDYDDTIDEKPELLRAPVQEDVVEKVERETKAAPKGPQIADFSVNEETGEISAKKEEKPAKPEQPKEGKDDLGDLI